MEHTLNKIELCYRQCALLYKAVHDFIEHDEEANCYLSDDLSYLVSLVEQIEKKVYFLSMNNLAGNGLFITVCAMIKKAKQSLNELLQSNLEVIIV